MSTFTPKHILAAVDLGPLSELVAGAAARLAEAYGASLELILAHTPEAPLEFTHDQVESIAGAQRRDLRVLEYELREWSRGRVPPSTRLRVATGQPAEVILDAAGHADLIVVGTHGRSGLARWRLGSTSEAVLRAARVPVLAVRHVRDLPAAVVPRLLCPVNFTPVSQAALEAALSLSAHFHGPLTVMTSAEGEEQLEPRLQASCGEVAAGVGHCPQPRLVVRRGQAAEEILQLAQEEQSDLIVLGAQRRPSLSETLFGSTTEQLLRHLPSSLLVIPAPADGP